LTAKVLLQDSTAEVTACCLGDASGHLILGDDKVRDASSGSLEGEIFLLFLIRFCVLITIAQGRIIVINYGFGSFLKQLDPCLGAVTCKLYFMLLIGLAWTIKFIVGGHCGIV